MLQPKEDPSGGVSQSQSLRTLSAVLRVLPSRFCLSSVSLAGQALDVALAPS